MEIKKLFYLVYIFSIVVLLIPTNIPVNSSNSDKYLSSSTNWVFSGTIVSMEVNTANLDSDYIYYLNYNESISDNEIRPPTFPLMIEIHNFTTISYQIKLEGNGGDIINFTLASPSFGIIDSLLITIRGVGGLIFLEDIIGSIIIIGVFLIIFLGIIGNIANPIKMLNRTKKDHRSALILDTFKGGGAIARMPDVGIEKTSFQDTEILEVIEPTSEIIDQCMICRLPINLTDVMVSCDECGSEFHNRHWKEWMKMKGSCPICKFKHRNVEHAEGKKKKT